MVAGGAILCGCWTLFAQDRARDNSAPANPGRFAVVAGSGEIIMYEAQTGQSWSYIPSVAKGSLPSWIPIQRLDSKEAVDKFAKQIQQQMRDEDSQQNSNRTGAGAY